jgi:phosphonate transport system ATP-binding protein
MDILRDINQTDGKTVVVTLHQVDYALRYCERVVALKGGHIHFDGKAAQLSEPYLNQLYGSDPNASLLLPTATRRHDPAADLVLAAA